MINWRKVGMTSSHHGLRPGLPRAYNGAQREATSREQADLIKCVVVRIESATRLRKSESLVIVDQNATVNTFPGLVRTARHTMEWVAKRSR